MTPDQIIMGGFQLLLVVLAIYGLRMDKGWFMPRSPLEGSSVQRGPESWNQLDFAFGIVSVNLLQVIGNSDAFPGVMFGLGLLDLTLLIYLFFFNGWFRNKTLGWVSKARTLNEPVR